MRDSPKVDWLQCVQAYRSEYIPSIKVSWTVANEIMEMKIKKESEEEFRGLLANYQD